MTTTPPPHHKQIARHLAEQWEVQPAVQVWRAQGTSVAQAIASAPSPSRRATVFSTIGLSDRGGYEIAALASFRNRSFVKVIFDVASFVAEGTRTAEVGSVFPKAVSRFYRRAEAGHLLLSDLALRDLRLADAATDQGRVRWLYAIPVTSDELVFKEASGYPALRELLGAGVDQSVTDLGRDSVGGVPRFDPWAPT